MITYIILYLIAGLILAIIARIDQDEPWSIMSFIMCMVFWPIYLFIAIIIGLSTWEI